MMKKLTALLLCLVLALSLCACGEAATEPEAPVREAPVSDSGALLEASKPYVDSCLLYLDIRGALLNTVEQRIAAHNAVLEAAEPQSYYLNSDYLLMVYVPFYTAYPSVVTDAIMSGVWDNAALSEENGVYRAEFPYTDKTSGEAVERVGVCTWEFSENGAFRVNFSLDGELREFTEFVPQGNDTYLLYTMTDRALIGYQNGEVTSICHAHRIAEPALEGFGGDLRYFSQDSASYYPEGKASRDEIRDDADAQYLLTLENDTMVYAGRIGTDVLDANGAQIGVNWVDIDPITFRK